MKIIETMKMLYLTLEFLSSFNLQNIYILHIFIIFYLFYFFYKREIQINNYIHK